MLPYLLKEMECTKLRSLHLKHSMVHMLCHLAFALSPCENWGSVNWNTQFVKVSDFFSSTFLFR